jgi:hypothetical protein
MMYALTAPTAKATMLATTSSIRHSLRGRSFDEGTTISPRRSKEILCGSEGNRGESGKSTPGRGEREGREGKKKGHENFECQRQEQRQNQNKNTDCTDLKDRTDHATEWFVPSSRRSFSRPCLLPW